MSPHDERPSEGRPSGFADAIERAGTLPGAEFITAAPEDLRYVRAADRLAVPLMAGHGVLLPGGREIDFPELLDDIAGSVGAGPNMDEACSPLKLMDECARRWQSNHRHATRCSTCMSLGCFPPTTWGLRSGCASPEVPDDEPRPGLRPCWSAGVLRAVCDDPAGTCYGAARAADVAVDPRRSWRPQRTASSILEAWAAGKSPNTMRPTRTTRGPVSKIARMLAPFAACVSRCPASNRNGGATRAGPRSRTCAACSRRHRPILRARPAAGRS